MDGAIVAGDVEAVAQAIADLVVPPHPEAVEELLRLRDRLDAKISEALRGFDAAESWRSDGSLSLTAWVAAHGRLAHREAHRDVLAARRLASLPVTADAWASGMISSAQVAAVVMNVSSESAALYASHEAGITPLLCELSVRGTAAAMRSWRLHAEATQDGAEPAEHASELYMSRTLDGRREISGCLNAEDAAVVEAAIAVTGSGTRDALGRLYSAAERRAEALVDLCRWFLDNYDGAEAGRARPHVSVIVGLSELASGLPGRLTDGTAVRGETIERLSCDSELHRIVMSGRSTVLDYGSATRTISPAIWAALVARDTHCRHPGCDRPPPWCEAHHVVHFSKGGPTCLTNLVLACTRHHHLWHEGRWELDLGKDAALRLRSPAGVVLTSQPPPVRLWREDVPHRWSLGSGDTTECRSAGKPGRHDDDEAVGRPWRVTLLA